MKNNIKTLVISPHCDDEVLGCGGILNNRQGESYVYYLGVDLFHVVKRKDRVKEVHNVADFLKFEFEISNGQVNNYKRELMINEITDIINELTPKEIFIPNGSGYNQDHKEVYDACMVALRPHDLNHFVPNVYVYEVEQYLLWGDHSFEPNYFEAIDVEKKMAAYQLYESQVRSMRPIELLQNYSYATRCCSTSGAARPSTSPATTRSSR
jgi:LmbE family N-acetylglucosaminyl deacetylase